MNPCHDLWTDRRNADVVADAAKRTIRVCLSAMEQIDGGPEGARGTFGI